MFGISTLSKFLLQVIIVLFLLNLDVLVPADLGPITAFFFKICETNTCVDKFLKKLMIFRPPDDLPKPTLYENIPVKERKLSIGASALCPAPPPPPRKT